MPITSVDLSTYVRVGRYDLPEPTRTTAPTNSLLAQEVSAVTYNKDTDTLFVVGDGGTSIVQVSKTGVLIDSMTLAPGSSPQGTEFYDPEGLTYVGGGKFVMTEERDRNAVEFTYVANTTLTRAAAKTVALGTNVGNIGLEGLTYDPQTGGYIFVKEKTPESIFQTGIDFAAGTATNGSAATVNSTDLFDPSKVGVVDFADVFSLSNLSALNGKADSSHLLVLSQESAKIVNVDRSGTVFSSLTIVSDAGNPLSVVDQQHEGMTMDNDGNLYVVSENGGGDFDHPQLWVYAPSAVTNQAPTAIALPNKVTSIVENSSTTTRVKVADVALTDDGLGTNTLSLSGTDASLFEVDSTGLYLKAGTVIDYETKTGYSISVNVDDTTVGATPDATVAYTLSVTDVVNEAPVTPTIYISEVAPWSSGNSPVAADWFEVTNSSGTAIDITGWKIDDNSDSFAAALSLSGITSIAAGESVIFIETADLATTGATFLNTWFGGSAPAGLHLGNYTGAGAGLSTGGDKVNLFNAAGVLQASVSFGASPTGTFTTFNNAAGLNNATITKPSAAGENGAFVAANDTKEIGSPGTVGRLFVSEVAPWASSSSPVAADWFEVTNTTAFAVDITGWKMDDNSGSAAAAVALNGITSIAPGESVIFIETANLATMKTTFLNNWFGSNPPANLQIGSYTGAGVGLGTAGDAVNLYNAGNALQANVSFGASPSGPFATFNNAGGLNGVAISTLSAVGVNAAFTAINSATEIGSPGKITLVNEAPVAVDDSLTGILNNSGARTIGFASLTGNDKIGPANESGQTLTITGVANPVGGTVSISGTDVIFTPSTSFTGKASFDYTVQDNGTTYGLAAPLTDVGSASFTISAAPFSLQLLHFYGESGTLGAKTAPILGAMVDKFKSTNANTLVLAEGDTWIPGPWLVGGADPSLNAVAGIGTTALGRPDIAILNALGVNASALGNHEFDLGSPVVSGAIAFSGTGASAWVGAQFPFITSNLDFSADSALRGIADATLGGTGTNAFAGKEASTIKGKIAPYTVVTVAGEKIGIVGATTYDLLTKTSPNGTVPKDDANPSTSDLQEVAAYIQTTIDALRTSGVNKIVMVDQLDTITRNQALAPMLSGVDIMVAGGGHERLGDANDIAVGFNGHSASFQDTYPILATDKDGNPTLIVTTDTEFSYLGRLQVEFDANGLLNTAALNSTINGAYAANEATLQSVYASTQTAAQIVAASTTGAKVQAIAGAIDAVVTAKDGNKFGFSKVYLEGDRVFGRAQETNLGNLTADANAFAARKALGLGATGLVSLKNGGGLRASIGSIDEDGAKIANALVGGASGNVSQLDVENALRFDNKMMTMDTTPQGLLNILNYAAGLPAGNGGFAQIGGLRFSYNPSLPAGSKVVNVALYDLDGKFIATVVQNGVVAAGAPSSIPMVILNFTANGGDGYPITANATNFRFLLSDGTLSAPVDPTLDFTATGVVPANAVGEQKLMQDYMLTKFATPDSGFNMADTPASQDLRIENLSARTTDAVLPAATVSGTSADESFTATGLNDTINGAGGSDTVVFDVARSAATILRTGPAAWTVTTATGGTDVLSNVEVLKFTDSSLYTTSQTPYLVAGQPNVRFTSILSAGDVAGVKPDNTTPWRMVGVPDGLGAFDNGDGTITVLMNQEVVGGVVRASGATGSFVARLVVDKSTLSVVSGSDADSQVFLWNSTSQVYELSTTALGRFCSADLAAGAAFYNEATGKGTQDRIFLNGEEVGAEGRPMAHIATGADKGKAYELPKFGNAAWENLAARPVASDKTVVIGQDDQSPTGQVYVYIGTKTNTGTTLDKAGLTNGALYGIKADFVAEASTGTPLSGSFTLAALPDETNRTGAQVETDSDAAGVTEWRRPEDGAWDVTNPNRYYFVTTNAINAPSRLWALDFVDPTDPTKGGTYTALLDGTEGQQMFDNMTVGADGTLILQEDVGNNARSGKIWHYDPKTDVLVEIAQHDVARFGNESLPATAPFTQDEESSGVIEVTGLLGYTTQRAFLLDSQAHYPFTGANAAEVVEGGQLQLMTIDTVVHGTSGNDFTIGTFIGETIQGGDGNDWTMGNGGADTIVGGNGNDYLDGGIGDDMLSGGADNDTYKVDSAGDSVTEASAQGNDTIDAALAALTLGANIENLRFVGTGGFAGTGNGLGNFMIGGTGNDTLNGLDGNDWMLANDGADTLLGGIGNDYLDGGVGADAMTGGVGDDTYRVDNAGDVVTEAAGEGNDTVETALASLTLAENVEALVSVGTGAFVGTGNGLNNHMIGGAGNDTLNGLDGSDWLIAGLGTDTLNGGNGNDFLDGGVGADAMAGGVGDDTYRVDNAGDVVTEAAGEGNDTVETTLGSFSLAGLVNLENLRFIGSTGFVGTGNAGNNFLIGSTGADTLNGGAGVDTLVGDAGTDSFVFTKGEANGDLIADFVPGVDHIDFNGYSNAATFTQIAGVWTVTDGALQETIRFAGATPSLTNANYAFATSTP